LFERLPLAKVPTHDVLDVNVIGLIPLGALSGRNLEVGGLEPVYATRDAWFDFLVGGKGEIHLLMAWRGELRVWRGTLDLKPTPGDLSGVRWDNAIDPMTAADPKERLGSDDAKPVMRIPTRIDEPFHAFADAGHFYFVTASGKLHCCNRRGDKQRTKLLWEDAQRPMDAVVCDSATGKAWGFTSGAGKELPPMWFQLAAELRPATYDRRPGMGVKKDDPLPGMLEYARLLMAEKKVKASE
jgi:hypothetical protein